VGNYDDLPTVAVRRIEIGDTDIVYWIIDCPYCGAEHSHDAAPRHRHSHCHQGDGYVITGPTEQAVRSMPKAERVAYLKACGWTRIDSHGSQVWRDPEETGSFTLAAAIRHALGVSTAPTFGAWLRQQTDRSDPIGDLARDYAATFCPCPACIGRNRARNRPKTVEGVRAELNEHDASAGAYEALEQAEEEWQVAALSTPGENLAENTAHTLNPDAWPETATGAQSAICCDGCHASIGEIQTTGHRWGCTTPGRHQHHTQEPLADCLYYREWRQTSSQRRGAFGPMAQPKMLCQVHERGRSPFDNRLDAGRYLAAAECDPLPEGLHREDHIIRRGYAVGFGQWVFFTAREPALVFGRAARMSLDCHAYGVYEAAHETRHCQIHAQDERVLLVNLTASLSRADDEVDDLKRFVQGVKEHPWSSTWHPPTGFVTELTDGQVVTTRQRSLPL